MTVTLDRIILHAVKHHSSTYTYIPNFTEIENFLWTDGRTGGWTFETHFIRPTLIICYFPNNLLHSINNKQLRNTADKTVLCTEIKLQKFYI